MILQNLLGENNITVSVSLNDLKEFALDIIEQTKREIEDLVVAQKSETYVSRKRAAEMLDVDSVTLWRWANRNYLVPATVGGKKRYKMSDINNMLNFKK